MVRVLVFVRFMRCHRSAHTLAHKSVVGSSLFFIVLSLWRGLSHYTSDAFAAEDALQYINASPSPYHAVGETSEPFLRLCVEARECMGEQRTACGVSAAGLCGVHSCDRNTRTLPARRTRSHSSLALQIAVATGCSTTSSNCSMRVTTGRASSRPAASTFSHATNQRCGSSRLLLWWWC